MSVPWGVTWEEANKAANKTGGHLVTITSKSKNDFIYKLIKNNKNAWTPDGVGNSYGPWVGGYKKEGSSKPDEGWQWITGEKFKYSNWAEGEPNNYNGAEDRICFYRQGNEDKPIWNDINKDTILSAFIIEFDNPKK